MRTARTYTLPADVIAMLDDLAREIANGNRSLAVERCIRRVAIDVGIREAEHLGVPGMKWADSEGKPRCNPHNVKGVCPVCYEGGKQNEFILNRPNNRFDRF
jgi:hypothetical protein